MFTKEGASRGGKKSRRGANKLTKELRAKFKMAIESVDLIADLKKVTPVDRLKMVAMLAKYVIPQLASIDLDIQDVTIKQFLKMDSQEQQEYIQSLEIQN